MRPPDRSPGTTAFPAPAPPNQGAPRQSTDQRRGATVGTINPFATGIASQFAEVSRDRSQASERESKSLADKPRVAEDLGAEVLRAEEDGRSHTHADRPLRHVSRIVIGHSQHSRCYALLHGSPPPAGHRCQRGRQRRQPALRIELRVPWLADRTDALRDWHQTSLLSVEVCHLRRWYQPGLLLIGDAAHTMSPVGGVGISEAIQDAVVASNVLGPRLRAGHVRESDLAAVQRRREWPVRIVQGYQRLVQASLMATSAGVAAGRVPLGGTST